MTDTARSQETTDGEGVLTYRGLTWRVQSEPVVVESENGLDLVEVWVKRGEDIE